MKTSKMPPGLARYWRTHKRPGSKKHTKRRRSSGHVTHHAPAHRKHARCSHEGSLQVMAGVRGVRWCGHCGALCDGERWRRPSR